MQLTGIRLVNTYSPVASAIYATSGSKLTATDVDLSGLEGPDSCNFDNSAVIVAELANIVQIADSRMQNNACAYIYSDRSNVRVQNTTLSEGDSNPFIIVKGAGL